MKNKQLDNTQINMYVSKLTFSLLRKDFAKAYLIINEIKEIDSPKLYREILTRCNLPKNVEEELKGCLRNTMSTPEGTAENFFYEYQMDPDYIKEIIPGGIIGIKLFIEEAFIKKGIEMPEDIKRRLDFVIEAKKEADINTSLEVLRQHVFKDNKAEHPPIPFDYKLALMYRNKDQ